MTEYSDEDEAIAIYETMQARTLGQLHALEVLVTVLLENRNDLDSLARRTDAVLLKREAEVTAQASVGQDFPTKTHEAARQHLEAIFANARNRHHLP